MPSLKTPGLSDWDRFWKKEKSKDSPSWSKKRMIQVIHPFLGKGKRILDAGCGSGFFSKFFCDQGLETTALDFSRESLRLTEQLTSKKAKVIHKDLLNERLSASLGNDFDVIFSDGLLEHFPWEQQKQILSNLSSVLSSRGVLITFVPNRFSFWQVIRPFFMPGIDERPFTLKELVQLNETCHFKVIQMGGVNTLPFKFSPEPMSSICGMLLYTIANK